MIDLRSDTVTVPTPAMREAMLAAPVGDDVYGEDPTVIELEQRTAELLGHEAGLFCTSGSLANLLGRPAAGRARAGGRLRRRRPHRPGRDGCARRRPRPDHADRPVGQRAGRRRRVRRGDRTERRPLPGVHRRGRRGEHPQLRRRHDPAVRPVGQLSASCAGPRVSATTWTVPDSGTRTWPPGSRWRRTGSLFDTVSVCFSKGLGAPVGSVLVGSAARIAQARIWRKRLGGGWRQAGILAAGALHALDHHVDRLAEDHRGRRRVRCRGGRSGAVGRRRGRRADQHRGAEHRRRAAPPRSPRRPRTRVSGSPLSDPGCCARSPTWTSAVDDARTAGEVVGRDPDRRLTPSAPRTILPPVRGEIVTGCRSTSVTTMSPPAPLGHH